VIVVIGAVFGRGAGVEVAPAGLAAGIALAASATESRVELVARIGDDPPGDALLLAFAAAGIGHVATLRDPARATPVELDDDEVIDPDPELDAGSAGGSPVLSAPTLDAADVGLALRYLSDYRVIVVVHPADAGVVREVVAAASWASAHLVVVTAPRADVPTDLPPASVVLEAPDNAAGLADLLGRYAVAVDAGEDPSTAFAALSASAAAGSID